MKNYQKQLETLISNIDKSNKPKLLLHACCAPCSSYVLEFLSDYFDITLFFYNPNISPKSEFNYREEELTRLIKEMKLKIKIVTPEYNDKEFYEIVKGYEDLPEGNERCFKCYELRLHKACEYAKKESFDYFTTTLSISPYKNAEKLNEISNKLSEEYNIKALPSDFKKNNGYKRSIELSKIFNLYRQDYCGCVYSKRERDNKK